MSMRKFNIKKMLQVPGRWLPATAVLMLALTGCKKYLETPPDNRTTLDTPEKVAQLLGTAYPQGNYMAFAESISDNVADKGVGGLDLTVLNPYMFQDEEYNQQDSPEFYWNACYSAIAAANQALQSARAAKDTTPYKSEIGEALLCRAYAHFMLANFFAKTYDATSAATDPGIPYVTEPENVVFKQYDRKTVAYVYQMIEKDLTQGLPLLDDKRYTVPRYHFTKAAAHAFAARFYLFKKDYANVIAHANQVLPTDVTSILRPWNTTYITITYVDLFARYAKATEPANLLLVETSSLWARNYYTQRYGMEVEKRSEIFDFPPCGGDYAYQRQLLYLGTPDNSLLPKINEYFVKQSVNATIGLPYVMVPILTAEEVLFNRVEANIMLNNYNAALADLNAYASTRIYPYSPSGNNMTVNSICAFYGVTTAQAQPALLQATLDFKRAEYAQEGMRWFDLQRYKVPVTHTIKTGTSITGTFTLTATDPRRLFQLPGSVATSGVPLNPR